MRRVAAQHGHHLGDRPPRHRRAVDAADHGVTNAVLFEPVQGENGVVVPPAGYLKAADYHPEHAPTLRRLIAFYFSEGELGSLLEVLAELERQREPIGESVAS